jgi:hypothetical protein
MKIPFEKYKNLVVISVILLITGSIIFACQKNDDVPPILTLNGADSVKSHPLNQVYSDGGAKAIDETDGDISENIFVESNVNVDRLGWYTVTYNVADKGGNSALPLVRHVRVINSGWPQSANYWATEVEVFNELNTCSYPMFFELDSSLNYRMIFTSFACENGLNVYADMSDTLLVIPFQTVEDSVKRISFQGSGYINDSLIFMDYKRITDTLTTYWNATFIR